MWQPINVPLPAGQTVAPEVRDVGRDAALLQLQPALVVVNVVADVGDVSARSRRALER